MADELPRWPGGSRVRGCRGGAHVPRPAGVDPPTQLSREGAARELAPLVETYATVPYRDLNPSLIAGLAYVVMFGMMFADVGHGALLLLAAVAIRAGWWAPTGFARSGCSWPVPARRARSSGSCTGSSSARRVVPVVWLAPLDHPMPLLVAAVGSVPAAGRRVRARHRQPVAGGWIGWRASTHRRAGGVALFVGLVAGRRWRAIVGRSGWGCWPGAWRLRALRSPIGLGVAAGGRGSGRCRLGRAVSTSWSGWRRTWSVLRPPGRVRSRPTRHSAR